MHVNKMVGFSYLSPAQLQGFDRYKVSVVILTLRLYSVTRDCARSRCHTWAWPSTSVLVLAVSMYCPTA